MAIDLNSLTFQYRSTAGADGGRKNSYSFTYADPNGQSYTFVPDSVINQGVKGTGDNQFVFPWFLDKENLATLGKNSQKVDFSSTADGSYYKDDVGSSTTGFLFPTGSIPFDGEVRTFPKSKGEISGISENNGQLVYVQKPVGGEDSRYLTPDGTIHSVTQGSSWLGDTFGGLGDAAADFINSDIGKLAITAGALYAGGAFDPSSAAATGGGVAGAEAAATGGLENLAATDMSLGAAGAANAAAMGISPEAAAWDAATAGAYGGEALAAGAGAGAATAAGAGAAGAAGAGAAAAGAGAAAAGAGAGFLDSLGKYAVPAAIAGSALLGADAAKSAAETQAESTKQANELLYKMYGESKELQSPYVKAGVTAQNRLMDLLGLSGNTTAEGYGSANKAFTYNDLTADPSYNFRLTEGLKALDRQAAARGGLISGGAIKAAQTYGQEQASQEYNNAFNRYQTNRTNMLQPLGNLITSGQNAAANVGAAGSNYGTSAANNITSGGAATAAGNVGTANAIASGVGQYLNYNQNENLMNALIRQRQSAYTG